MSENNQNFDPLGALIGFVIVAVIGFFFIVYIVLPVAIIIAAGGACWGGGHAVINYVKAFSNNVSWRKSIDEPS